MLKNFRVLGHGSMDWPGWMEVLRENRWSGWATEEIDHSEDPIGDLQAWRTSGRTSQRYPEVDE